MRPTRNWTTYVPESENALRKKCIELSPPVFPLPPSSTNNTSSKTSPAAAAAAAATAFVAHRHSSQNQSNNNNNNNNNHSSHNNNIDVKNINKNINNNNNQQIKDCERNGMKNNFCKSADSVNKTVAHFSDNVDNDDDDENEDGDDDHFQFSSAKTAIAAAAAATVASASKNDTPLKLDFDKSFESCATTNSIDTDTDCDKSELISKSSLERAPLIQLSPNKSITLVKQNSTSLIFTKKDVNPVAVHRKRVTVVRSVGTHSNNETITTTADPSTEPDDNVPIISQTNESIQSSKKRHSFHWQADAHGQSVADKIKRKQIKSWYAVVGSPSVRESSFDGDTQVLYTRSYLSIFEWICI